jgi:hypothetical protein
MHPHLHDGKKVDWEEFRWDQDVGRWVGPFRDEAPMQAVAGDEDDDPKHPHGLLD